LIVTLNGVTFILILSFWFFWMAVADKYSIISFFAINYSLLIIFRRFHTSRVLTHQQFTFSPSPASKYLKLFRVVLVHECDWYTQNPVVIQRDIDHSAHFNRIIIIIFWILLWRISLNKY